MYPKELYKDNLYRVVWGPEEEQKFVSKGWKEDKEDGAEYVVHTAHEVNAAPKEPKAPKA